MARAGLESCPLCQWPAAGLGGAGVSPVQFLLATEGPASSDSPVSLCDLEGAFLLHLSELGLGVCVCMCVFVPSVSTCMLMPRRGVCIVCTGMGVCMSVLFIAERMSMCLGWC